MNTRISMVKPLVAEGVDLPEEVHVSISYTVASGSKSQPKPKRFSFSRRNKEKAVDMDHMAIAFNTRDEVASSCRPEHTDPFFGAVVHQGDAEAKPGETATETIVIRPQEVPASIKGLVMALVACGDSHAFGQLDQVYLQVTDGHGVMLHEDHLTIERGNQAQMVFRLVRQEGSTWGQQSLALVVGEARDWKDVAESARQQLNAAS